MLLEESPITFSPFRYRRRLTRAVMVGSVGVGGNNPIRVQSMTTTPTLDTTATVEQIKRLADVGCEIARITAPTVREAHNLQNIKKELVKAGVDIPLVADIHFRPDAALVAADFVEKVRINPGNFVDGKAFKIREYTEQQYAEELQRIEEKFTPLVLKLKKLKRALRIGTNHGSLSDRIMNRFGDTPLGMVESALEYVRLCQKNDYHDIILSMKASNPRVMIAAYRLLAERMEEEQMDYPFHLGVTEAGDGEDGRIKSAIGIGSLLEDGLGDTIRVSLTEEPECEIPVAKELAAHYTARWKNQEIKNTDMSSNLYQEYVPDRMLPTRRETTIIKSGPLELGGTSPIRILSAVDLRHNSAAHIQAIIEERVKTDTPPEILEVPYDKDGFTSHYKQFRKELLSESQRVALWVSLKATDLPVTIDFDADGFLIDMASSEDVARVEKWVDVCKKKAIPLVVRSPSITVLKMAVDRLNQKGVALVVAFKPAEGQASVHLIRELAMVGKVPILLDAVENQPGVLTASIQGSLICDGIGDVVSVGSQPVAHSSIEYAYNLLQATGNRITKTEFVSCPSCGRTLFDLQSTTERIKSKTGHLKGVKIAIMGCIVNGPGEMADADFGYVGGGPGKINLYVGKTCVAKSIPSDLADQKLIDLIKSHGKWVDPR